MNKQEFKTKMLKMLDHKPLNWRDGQTIFNNIDEEYGVARIVQYNDRIDCFYDDSQIDAFINAAWEHIKMFYE